MRSKVCATRKYQGRKPVRATSGNDGLITHLPRRATREPIPRPNRNPEDANSSNPRCAVLAAEGDAVGGDSAQRENRDRNLRSHFAQLDESERRAILNLRGSCEN